MRISNQMKKTILAILLLIGNMSLVKAQRGEDHNYLPNYIPPSPEAASLGQYADHPVSYYSGMVKTNIPLFQVSSGKINVPIGLSYHGGGIKLEQMASRVGLGWSLDGIGAISRTVAGYPDEIERATMNCGVSS